MGRHAPRTPVPLSAWPVSSVTARGGFERQAQLMPSSAKHRKNNSKREVAGEWRLRLTFRGSLRAMRLHRDVRVEVVQRAVGLLTAVPTTLVHSLNLLIASPGSLMLLRAWDRDEGVHLSGLVSTGNLDVNVSGRKGGVKPISLSAPQPCASKKKKKGYTQNTARPHSVRPPGTRSRSRMANELHSK